MFYDRCQDVPRSLQVDLLRDFVECGKVLVGRDPEGGRVDNGRNVAIVGETIFEARLVADVPGIELHIGKQLEFLGWLPIKGRFTI